MATKTKGQIVGLNGCVLFKQTRKDRHSNWHGLFVCGRCKTHFEAQISSVKSGHTTSCGCRQRETSRINRAKISRSTLQANGRKTGAANGRKNAAAMNLHPTTLMNRAAIGRKTGAANSLAAAKSRRDFCGITYHSCWEVVAAASLRKDGREFKSQPGPFDLGDLGSYWPDFYIPSLDLYIEVKGQQREKAMAKFERFKQTHKCLLITQAEITKLMRGVRNPSKLSNRQIAARVLPFTEFLLG